MSGVSLLSTPAMAAFPGRRLTHADSLLVTAASSPGTEASACPRAGALTALAKAGGGGGAIAEDTPPGRGNTLGRPNSLSHW